jgi:hypothetical protein
MHLALSFDLCYACKGILISVNVWHLRLIQTILILLRLLPTFHTTLLGILQWIQG